MPTLYMSKQRVIAKLSKGKHRLLLAAKRLGRNASRRLRQRFQTLYHNLLHRPRYELFIALLAIALLIFVSPIVTWWADPARSWLAPYLLWAFIIALAYLIQRLQRHDL